MNQKMHAAIIATTLFANVMTTLGGTIPKVNINSNKILMQQSPFTENNRMFIPLRSVSENLGANVKWDGSTETLILL